MNQVTLEALQQQIDQFDARQHLAFLDGKFATQVVMSGGNGAIGDCVCVAQGGPVPPAAPSVVKALAAPLANASRVLGVLTQPISAGNSGYCAMMGVLPPSVTGLSAGSRGLVRVDPTTGRCQRVTGYVSTDFPVGSVDSDGNLTLNMINDVGVPTKKTLYALDFTAQGNQTLTSNGTYTIDGRSWTVENGANANSILLATAAGLTIAAKAGAALYGDNVRTAPIARVKLTDLIGFPLSLATIGGLRFLFRIQLSGVSQDFQFGQAGIEWSGLPAQFNGITQKGFHSAVSGIGVQCGVSTSAVTTRTAVVASSDDVLGLVWRPPWTYDFSSAVYDVSGNKFPDTQTFRRSLMGSLGTNVPRDDQLNLFLAASPTGAAAGFSATFTHMLIEQLP